MYGFRFGSDGEGSQNAAAQRKADVVALLAAQIALAQDLHSNNALALVLHLLENRDDGVGIGIHITANGIQPGEVDFDPRRSGSCAQSLNGMARAAVGANDALLLCFRQYIEDGTESGGPVRLGGAVDEHDIDSVDAQFLTEALEVCAHTGRCAAIGLGEHRDFVARQLLESLRDEWMAAVGVRGIKEAQAVFVEAVQKQIHKAVGAKEGLI